MDKIYCDKVMRCLDDVLELIPSDFNEDDHLVDAACSLAFKGDEYYYEQHPDYVEVNIEIDKTALVKFIKIARSKGYGFNEAIVKLLENVVQTGEDTWTGKIE